MPNPTRSRSAGEDADNVYANAVYLDRDKELILSGPIFKDDLTGDEAERHDAEVYGALRDQSLLG